LVSGLAGRVYRITAASRFGEGTGRQLTQQLAQCQESSRSVLSAMRPVRTTPDTPHPPGNLHRYQNKGVAKFDCWNLLKTQELIKGKKGKNRSMKRRTKPSGIQKARK